MKKKQIPIIFMSRTFVRPAGLLLVIFVLLNVFVHRVEGFQYMPITEYVPYRTISPGVSPFVTAGVITVQVVAMLIYNPPNTVQNNNPNDWLLWRGPTQEIVDQRETSAAGTLVGHWQIRYYFSPNLGWRIVYFDSGQTVHGIWIPVLPSRT